MIKKLIMLFKENFDENWIECNVCRDWKCNLRVGLFYKCEVCIFKIKNKNFQFQI